MGNVIQVEYATTAKKVNVRKLKYKLWDKLAKDLPQNNNKENVEIDSNRNIKQDEDEDDIQMNENGNNKLVTFQEALDSLPCNISSSISVHMCFICLLHLANEEEEEENAANKSQMVLERGNFEIQYANSQSQ